MKKAPHTEVNQDNELQSKPGDLNFHPVLKDIENIFWLFLLSNKALSLFETQNLLLLDDNFSPIIKRYNIWTGLEIKKDPTGLNYTTTLNILDQMIFLSKALVILMYDFLVASKYNSMINTDNNIQFLRYIRNGAAHNNQFNMKDRDGDWKLGEEEIIKWHNKKINRKIHGKKVFPGFINLTEILLLANEISERLIRIDNGKTAATRF